MKKDYSKSLNQTQKPARSRKAEQVPVRREGPLTLEQFFDNIIQLSLIRKEHKDSKFVALALRFLQDYPYEPLSTFRDNLNSINGYYRILKRYYPEILEECEKEAKENNIYNI